MTYYILDEDDIPKESNLKEWMEWYTTADLIIKKDTINDISISTVFIGINHNFMDNPPHIFETMIFGGEYDSYCTRYSTKKGALKGHEDAIWLVKSSS